MLPDIKRKFPRFDLWNYLKFYFMIPHLVQRWNNWNHFVLWWHEKGVIALSSLFKRQTSHSNYVTVRYVKRFAWAILFLKKRTKHESSSGSIVFLTCMQVTGTFLQVVITIFDFMTATIFLRGGGGIRLTLTLFIVYVLVNILLAYVYPLHYAGKPATTLLAYTFQHNGKERWMATLSGSI